MSRDECLTIATRIWCFCIIGNSPFKATKRLLGTILMTTPHGIFPLRFYVEEAKLHENHHLVLMIQLPNKIKPFGLFLLMGHQMIKYFIFFVNPKIIFGGHHDWKRFDKSKTQSFSFKKIIWYSNYKKDSKKWKYRVADN